MANCLNLLLVYFKTLSHMLFIVKEKAGVCGQKP